MEILQIVVFVYIGLAAALAIGLIMLEWLRLRNAKSEFEQFPQIHEEKSSDEKYLDELLSKPFPLEYLAQHIGVKKSGELKMNESDKPKDAKADLVNFFEKLEEKSDRNESSPDNS